MRVKFNPLARDELLVSPFVFNKYPIKINENTVIELGMGKGLMLLTLAKKYPDFNFIGIEKNETVAHKALELFQDSKIDNLKIIVEDIKNLNTILNGKVNKLFITFPDPWPKSRHEKRRLTSKEFLLIYKKILTKDGVIIFKSDNDKLYKYTLEIFNESNMGVIFNTTDLHSSIKNEDNVCTAYENKWSDKGKNINYIEAKFIYD